MVQALLNLNENTNRVLNIVKAKYGLKDKSEAITLMVKQYEEELLEPELRPEYLEKLNKIEKEGYGETFRTIEELRKKIEAK